MTPAALIKAESLARYVQHTGAPQSEFLLALTLGEGYELLDYLASGAMGRCANHADLEHDIADAKVKGDPFEILSQWSLLGFSIVRTMDLH